MTGGQGKDNRLRGDDEWWCYGGTVKDDRTNGAENYMYSDGTTEGQGKYNSSNGGEDYIHFGLFRRCYLSVTICGCRSGFDGLSWVRCLSRAVVLEFFQTVVLLLRRVSLVSAGLGSRMQFRKGRVLPLSWDEGATWPW